MQPCISKEKNPVFRTDVPFTLFKLPRLPRCPLVKEQIHAAVFTFQVAYILIAGRCTFLSLLFHLYIMTILKKGEVVDKPIKAENKYTSNERTKERRTYQQTLPKNCRTNIERITDRGQISKIKLTTAIRNTRKLFYTGKIQISSQTSLLSTMSLLDNHSYGSPDVT